MENKLKINKSSLLVGSDPEVFLRDKNTGILKSAIGLIPGEKNKPYRLSGLGEGFALQIDNVAAEFNVPPVNSATAMYDNIQKVITLINDTIPDNLEVAIQASGDFSDEECNHPIARLSGCSPDYNVWSMDINEKADYANTNKRACGAHIHISYDDNNDETSFALIKALDLFAGIPSVLLDDDIHRRSLYGKAGCFRPCEWGIEYRSLSNFWIKEKELVRYIFDAIDRAIDFVNLGKEFSDEDSLNIQTAINTNNKDLALELVYKYQMESFIPVTID